MTDLSKFFNRTKKYFYTRPNIYRVNVWVGNGMLYRLENEKPINDSDSNGCWINKLISNLKEIEK